MPSPLSNEDTTMSDQVPSDNVDVVATTTTFSSQDPIPLFQRSNHDRQLYYLPTAHLAPSQPHPSQNLIALYRLDKIAASVRRTDPTTGEKINKIRKSYEGKVKQLHIAGVNKALSTPHEFIATTEATGPGILDISVEDWRMKGLRPVENAPAFLEKLDRALNMAPGKLSNRESERWKKLIGTEEVPKGKVVVVPDVVTKKPGALLQPQPGVPSPNLRAQVQRPARAGAKRRYHDSTFKGYGEGFADELDAPSLSEDETREMGQLKKRRRKDLPVSSPLGPGTPYNNVGVMAGGVRR